MLLVIVITILILNSIIIIENIVIVIIITLIVMSNQVKNHNVINTFFNNLKNLRSIFSTLDIILYKQNIQPLLNILLYNINDIYKFFKYDNNDNIFLISLKKLQRFCYNSLNDIINLIILLDDCYYNLYYLLQIYNSNNSNNNSSNNSNSNRNSNNSNSSNSNRNRNNSIISSNSNNRNNSNSNMIIIPKPHIYFTTLIGDENILNKNIKEFMINNFTNDYIIEFSLLWDIERKFYNPLLHLQYSRWRETICIMSLLNLFSNDIFTLLENCKASITSSSSSSSSSLTMKGTDPLVPIIIRKIYDSNRVWPCHLYAFATPSIDALKKLSSFSSIIEIGSGTGYWAHLINEYHQNNQLNTNKKQHDINNLIKVYAYDKNPPSLLKHSKHNDYHGQSKSWTEVKVGGPEVISKYPNATLFLCYPPPDNDMALLALRSYKGDTIAYVGEIQGDTGSKSFENELFKYFHCEEVIKLPNWGDTCYSLMIWKRKNRDNINNKVTYKSYPFSCSYCQQTATTQLYRCRLTYSIYFCSPLCAGLAHDKHQNELTVRYLLCKQPSSLLVKNNSNSNNNLNSNLNSNLNNNDDNTCDNRITHIINIDNVGINEGTNMTKKQLKRNRKRKREPVVATTTTTTVVVNNSITMTDSEKAIETSIKEPLIELNERWYRRIKC